MVNRCKADAGDAPVVLNLLSLMVGINSKFCSFCILNKYGGK